MDDSPPFPPRIPASGSRLSGTQGKSAPYNKLAWLATQLRERQRSPAQSEIISTCGRAPLETARTIISIRSAGCGAGLLNIHPAASLSRLRTVFIPAIPPSFNGPSSDTFRLRPESGEAMFSGPLPSAGLSVCHRSDDPMTGTGRRCISAPSPMMADAKAPACFCIVSSRKRSSLMN